MASVCCCSSSSSSGQAISGVLLIFKFKTRDPTKPRRRRVHCFGTRSAVGKLRIRKREHVPYRPAHRTDIRQGHSQCRFAPEQMMMRTQRMNRRLCRMVCRRCCDRAVIYLCVSLIRVRADCERIVRSVRVSVSVPERRLCGCVLCCVVINTYGRACTLCEHTIRTLLLHTLRACTQSHSDSRAYKTKHIR